MKTTLLISSLLAIPASVYAEETTPPLLPEVTIQAQRSPDQVSKSVLTGKQARHIAGTSGDPLKALQSLPGVVSSNSGRPAVRGSGPQDNAYYVDDLPIGKIFHVGGISVFNADLIRDFNLYSAAFAPHYGNVTGAVIDVALREPRRDKLGGKVNVNLLGADALIEAPINENQAFYFAARRSYIDLLIKQVERKGITVQIPNYADYQGKYVAQLNDNHKLTLHAQGATDTLKLNIGTTSNLAKQDPILAGNLALSDRFNMQAASLDSVLFNAAANKLAVEHIASGFTTKVGGAGNISVAQDDVMLRERIIFPVAEQHELAVGSNLVRSKIDINADLKNTTCTQFNPNCNFTNAPNVRLLDSFVSQAIDGSLQDRWHVNHVLTLVTGVRYSYEDYLRRSYTEPRLGVEYQATPQTLYTVGWGRHNQMPTGQEISRNFGNPNLAHLRAEHSVLGVTQQLDKDWSIKGESYYKKLSNLTVDSPTLNYINAGSGRAYGLEMLLKKDIAQAQSGDVTGWLSVSLAKSTRRNDLTGASFRYALDQPVNATWVANMQLEDGWSVGSKWQVHSGAPYTPINGSLGVYPNGGNIPNYGAINSGTLPTFHQLDVRLQREAVKKPDYTLNYYVELNNVYQHKNVIGYSYDPSYTTKEAIYPFVLPLSFGVQAEF
jgi:TonB dependent receptor/TonB-dependent Receptor Plug Domain